MFKLVDELRGEIARLKDEARRFYRADGSSFLLETAEEAVALRIDAARVMAEAGLIVASAGDQRNEAGAIAPASLVQDGGVCTSP